MIQPSLVHLVAAFVGAFAVVILAFAVFLPQATSAHGDTRMEEEAKLSSLGARVPISEISDGLIVRRDGSF